MSALDKLFGRGNVTYHRAVADALDSVAAAIFAEQIAFWQDKSEDGWAFRTVDEIFEYTGLKKDAQQGARAALKHAGVLKEESRGMPRRNYYRIDLERLAALIAEGPPPAGGNPPSVGGNPPTSKREPANRSIEGVESEKESSVETADGSATAIEKPMPLGQFFNKELAERITARRESGRTIHTPTDREKKDFAAQFKALDKEGYGMDTLLLALEYQIAKAAGEIEGEPSAWCGFRTALDKVVLEQWSPSATGTADAEKAASRTQGYEWMFGDSEAELSEEEERKLAEIESREKSG